MSLTLASCSDLFEPAEENNRGLDEIYNEPTYAQGLLGYGYAMLPYNTKSVTDVATDDAVSNDLTNGYLKMATGSWTANNDPMSKWTSGRASIQYLNIFLQEVDKVNWAKDENARKMYCDSRKGEAYALRALNLYYLLMNHGGWTADGKLLGVPNLTEPESSTDDFNKPRNTFQECLDQIYSDLDEAAKLLPLDYNDLTDDNDVPAKYKEIGVKTQETTTVCLVPLCVVVSAAVSLRLFAHRYLCLQLVLLSLKVQTWIMLRLLTMQLPFLTVSMV